MAQWLKRALNANLRSFWNIIQVTALIFLWETKQDTPHAISAYLRAHLSLGNLPYLPTPMLSVKEKHVLFYRNLAALVPRVRKTGIGSRESTLARKGEAEGTTESHSPHGHLSPTGWAQILTPPSVSTWPFAGHSISLSLGFCISDGGNSNSIYVRRLLRMKWGGMFHIIYA